MKSVGHNPDGEIPRNADEAMTRLRRVPLPATRARVLAVDAQHSFLEVLRDVLGRTDRLEWVGEADSGEMAIELAEQLEPDVVLLDVRMPGLGGIEAATQIKTRYPSMLVVLISTVHPDELPEERRDSAADAVIWKSELAPRLLDEIWLLHRTSG